MHIEILVESDFDAQSAYLLLRVAEEWRENGHRVSTRRLENAPGQADVSFLHVDRSLISPEMVAPHERNGRLINARTLDITKRKISSMICAPDDPYDGPVILKSNLNSGGGPERVRAPRATVVKRVFQSWRRKLPWRLARQLGDYEFPVLANKRAVPAWVRRSDRIVVERFVPEMDGTLFVTRYWTFLGDRENVMVKRSKGHVGKAEDLVDYTFEEDVPEALRALRDSLGFGFGKFDFVMHDGEPVLLDANRTPAYGHVTAKHPEIIETLASGIEAYA